MWSDGAIRDEIWGYCIIRFRSGVIMEERLGDGWLYDGPAASRLWEKSAIGVIVDEGKLLLTDSEVIFCFAHRGIELPQPLQINVSGGWIAERAQKNPVLLQEAAILEALRVPGNKLVLSKNVESLGFEASASWGLRWNSDTHPSNDPPVSEVLWYHSKDELFDTENDPSSVLRRLLHWCSSVTNKGRIAEVLVIDDEQSVVTYRIQESNPRGHLIEPTTQTFKLISEMPSLNQGLGGSFIPDVSDWPREAIGIPAHDGRYLDAIESYLVEYMSSDPMKVDKIGKLSESASILLDLWMRGLNTRSGFKYGTTWRCYPGNVGDGHAPWLVIDPNKEGPANWADACLSSRLASGVNKQWLLPILDDGNWRYLEISRPPSDSRWSNPTRR